MNVSKYKKELNNIIKMAPVESGVQTLVYTLLEGMMNSKILLDVDSFNTDSMFASVATSKDVSVNGGSPDLAIVSQDFVYVPSIWRKNASNGRRSRYKMHEVNNIKLHEMEIDDETIGKLWSDMEKGDLDKNFEIRERQLKQFNIALLDDMRKNKLLGCVEVKATSVNLPENKKTKIQQLTCHLFQYKKVIYTNGLVWVYFEYGKSDFELLKNLIGNSLREMISKNKKDIQYEECYEKLDVREKKIIDEMGIKWIIPLVYNEDETVCPSQLVREEIEINEYKFNELLEKLQNIEWMIK